jgi:hypothetical protein
MSFTLRAGAPDAVAPWNEIVRFGKIPLASEAE